MAAHRTHVTFLLSLIGALALLVLPLSPAEAHTRLRDLNPADGSALAAAPSAVTMIFTDKVLAGTARIEIEGPDGEVPVTVTMSGATVTGALPTSVSSGAYTLTWRVAAADGHPISGTSTFSVLAAPTPSTSPSQADSTPSEVPSPSAAPTASPPATGTAPVDPLDPASALDGAGTWTTFTVSLGAVLAAAAAVGGLLARRRASPRRPGGGTP